MNEEEKIQPIPKEISIYIYLYHLNKPEYSKTIKNMPNIIKQLTELFEKAKEQCEIPLGHFEASQTAETPPSVKFLYHKLSKYVLKHKNILREINAKIATQLAIILDFFKKINSQQIAATFNFDGYKEYRSNLLKKDKKFQSYSKRILILQQNIKMAKKNFTHPTIESICEMVPSITHLYDQTFLYTPPNAEFDTIIQDFFVRYRENSDYKQIVNDLAGKGEQPPMNPALSRKRNAPKIVMNPFSFNKFVVSFLNTISSVLQVTDTPFSDEQKYIIRSAILRFVFDDIYVIDPVISYCNPVFFQNSYIISHLSPFDLNMPKIFADEEKYQTFVAFIPKIQVFSEALDILSTLQFYVSPLDIAYQLCKVSHLIDDFADQRSPSETDLIKLSFDDFFIIFVVCLSLSSMTNAEGISKATDFYNNLENSQMMRHAMTSISAGVSYIIKFYDENQNNPQIKDKIEKLKKEYNETSISFFI